MIKPVGPILQPSCEKVEFCRVQITGRWIYSQCVPVSRGRHTLRRADRSRKEQQLGKERRPFTRITRANRAVQYCKSWGFRGRWVRRQIKHRYSFVMTEGVGHVCPIQEVRLFGLTIQRCVLWIRDIRANSWFTAWLARLADGTRRILTYTPSDP
jgi:hypothetical protein